MKRKELRRSKGGNKKNNNKYSHWQNNYNLF